MVAGDVESGSEFGFITGVEAVGVVGIIVGTVVIGVVMSFRVLEIELASTTTCFVPWSACLLFSPANISATLEPGFQIKSKIKLSLESSRFLVLFTHYFRLNIKILLCAWFQNSPTSLKSQVEW
jgi:hypothetical protein